MELLAKLFGSSARIGPCTPPAAGRQCSFLDGSVASERKVQAPGVARLPVWELLWDKPTAREADGPRDLWYVFKLELPSAELFDIVWVWAPGCLLLRLGGRHRGRFAAPSYRARGPAPMGRARPRPYSFSIDNLLSPAHREGLEQQENAMLKWALIFAVIAVVAGLFGFTSVAAGAAGIAKILFIVFVVLFVLVLLVALLGIGAAS